jgi:hypothetical protein
MQNKRLILVMGVLVLMVGAAAFIAGRFLNQGLGPVGSISVSINPAPELPTTQPEVTGLFIQRLDNSIIVETKSLQTDGAVAVWPADTTSQSGPHVEVVVTSETIIYRETTPLSEPLSGGYQTIQQTVEEATRDELGTESMVKVWGRKSGDRIIAVVLMYSDTVMIKSELFEDCETCP